MWQKNGGGQDIWWIIHMDLEPNRFSNEDPERTTELEVIIINLIDRWHQKSRNKLDASCIGQASSGPMSPSLARHTAVYLSEYNSRWWLDFGLSVVHILQFCWFTKTLRWKWALSFTIRLWIKLFCFEANSWKRTA